MEPFLCYRLGHAVEFDWTWEGAVAFRPLNVKEFDASGSSLFEQGSQDAAISDSIVWSGELLEVDDATARIYILVADPQHVHCRGWFYVRPFEFSAYLNAIY
jgi:hypothetical protein